MATGDYKIIYSVFVIQVTENCMQMPGKKKKNAKKRKFSSQHKVKLQDLFCGLLYEPNIRIGSKREKAK